MSSCFTHTQQIYSQGMKFTRAHRTHVLAFTPLKTGLNRQWKKACGWSTMGYITVCKKFQGKINYFHSAAMIFGTKERQIRDHCRRGNRFGKLGSRNAGGDPLQLQLQQLSLHSTTAFLSSCVLKTQHSLDSAHCTFVLPSQNQIPIVALPLF